MGTWVIDDVIEPSDRQGQSGGPAPERASPNGSRANLGAFGRTAEASKSP